MQWLNWPLFNPPLQTTQTSFADSAEANATGIKQKSLLEAERDMAQAEISILYELMSNMSDQSNETFESMALQITELNQHMSNLSSMLNASYDRHQENVTLVSQLTAERDNLQVALEQANNTIASLLNTYSEVMLTDIAEMNYSTHCRGISKELSQGLDNGDGNGTAADGQLHVDEVDSIDHICSKIHLVKEIFSRGTGYPVHLTAVGNTLYFAADDGTNGYELWKSDGTASGTVMVKDINSGSSGSSHYHSGSSYPSKLTAVGNTLFFQANDGFNGHALWKSDGTASGTVLVADPYGASDNSYPLDELMAIGNTLFFEAYSTANGSELWKSDGTSSGTVMVKDINSGSGSSNPHELTAVGNTLYFAANDGTNGLELWKSDWNCLRHGDGQGYHERKWWRKSQPTHSGWQHRLFFSQHWFRWLRIVEERWNCLRHGDGQGYLQRIWQRFELQGIHSRWQHHLFLSQRRNQRRRTVEE